MIARKSVLMMATNGLGAILGAVGLFFMGRYMSPSSLGMFGFAFSIIGLASIFSELGLDQAHIKRVSEGSDLGDCIATFTVVKVLLTVLYTGGTLVFAALWAHYKGFFDATSLGVIAVVSAYFFVFQLRKIPILTFNAFTYVAKVQAAAMVENLVKIPGIVVVALLFGYLNGLYVPFRGFVAPLADLLGLTRLSVEQGAIGIGLAHLVGIVASLGIAGWTFHRHRYPFGDFDMDLLKRYIAFAKPIAIISVMGLISRRIDTMMVGYFWSARDVGYYFASERIITMILILPTAIGTVMFPTMSRMASAQRHGDLLRVADETQRLMAITIFPLVLLAVLYPREGIHIFLSDRFLPAAFVLQILSVYVLVYALSMVTRTIILGYDMPQINLRVGLVVVVSNVIFNTMLIPSSIFGVPLFGLKSEGAAIATLIAHSLSAVLLGVASRRITGHRWLGPHVMRSFAAAGVTGAVMHFVSALPVFGGLDRIWELGAAGAVTVLLYAILLILFGELKKRDVRSAWDAINPARMARYVRDEVRTEEGKVPRY